MGEYKFLQPWSAFWTRNAEISEEKHSEVKLNLQTLEHSYFQGFTPRRLPVSCLSMPPKFNLDTVSFAMKMTVLCRIHRNYELRGIGDEGDWGILQIGHDDIWWLEAKFNSNYEFPKLNVIILLLLMNYTGGQKWQIPQKWQLVFDGVLSSKWRNDSVKKLIVYIEKMRQSFNKKSLPFTNLQKIRRRIF